MSGGATAAYVMAAASVVSTAISYQNGVEQKKAAANAARQAKENADNQLRQAEEATNRANQRRADTGAALDSATQAGKAGASGTMLTGSQGIDPATLNLGKTTLLGS